MNDWRQRIESEVEFERLGPVARVAKRCVINPFANYLPAGWMRSLLRLGDSDLAKANWADPGGWQSMVISYEANCEKIADKLLVTGGTMPTALRNRRRLGAWLLARLIERAEHDEAHVLCLGAGPGMIIMDAMGAADKPSRATLVDLSSAAFEYGRQRADRLGLTDRVRFVEADVRDVGQFLDDPPDLVKMLGICEYIPDEPLIEIIRAIAAVTPPHAAIVYNSLRGAHGTDRFFRRVFGLHMLHRTPEQLQAMFAPAGFGEFEVFTEPLGVYDLVVARREQSGPTEPTQPAQRPQPADRSDAGAGS